MKNYLKYPLIFLLGLSMAGCGLMNTAIDEDRDDDDIDSVHDDKYDDLDDQFDDED